MKQKGAGDGGGEGPSFLNRKLLASPPSMAEIKPTMLPTLKKTSRREIELDAFTNPFKNKLIAEVDEEDPYPIKHEPYFIRGDDSPILIRKKKKKRVRHVELIDEEDDNNEDQNRFFKAKLNDKAHQHRSRSQSHYSRVMPSPNQIIVAYKYP